MREVYELSGKILKYLTSVIFCVASGAPLHASSGPEASLKAFTSIAPQAYLVERVGGEHVEVRVLVGEGQDPHTFEPTPAQMSALALSDVYFTIGVPFEAVFLPKIRKLFPGLKIADTAKGVKLRYFSHEHGDRDHEHEGRAADPHIWLDPKRAKVMAGNIASTLKALDPAHGDVFERNLRRFREDLDRLDAEIAGILDPVKGSTVYVFHPSFGYFCESYGLEQAEFEIQGKEPGGRQLARLIENAQKEGVKVIFVQPQFSVKAARVIAESIKAEVVVINPLSDDYLKEIKTMAEKIREAFSQPGRSFQTDEGGVFQ